MHSLIPQPTQPLDLLTTPTQAKALIEFRAYSLKYRKAPSYNQLGKLLGKTKADARQAIKRLMVRGLIVRTDSRYYGFELTTRGSRAAAALEREVKA